jgi:hypothetical protein
MLHLERSYTGKPFEGINERPRIPQGSPTYLVVLVMQPPSNAIHLLPKRLLFDSTVP